MRKRIFWLAAAATVVSLLGAQYAGGNSEELSLEALVSEAIDSSAAINIYLAANGTRGVFSQDRLVTEVDPQSTAIRLSRDTLLIGEPSVILIPLDSISMASAYYGGGDQTEQDRLLELKLLVGF
jgi:hypothetical protein